MGDDPKILKEFFGDEEFPVDWASDEERSLFWFFDDLHCPQPLSPMYFDIGGWWLTCDHMFRRFGTPFASDWIAKNINGYLYTAAIPARAGTEVVGMEMGHRYAPRTPIDPEYPNKIGAYLDAVLPTYGANFADWWTDRLVPEMVRNFEYLEERIERWSEIPLMEWATILEDALDIHDRHWKIHWMLNFSQLSAMLALQAAVDEMKPDLEATVLGRLQNSADDRNWDSIEALWKMKGEIAADEELSAAIFSRDTGGDILAALNASERGSQFVQERLRPYQKEFGWHAVWSHEFVFPTRYEQPEPILEVLKGYVDTDYDFPAAIAALKSDLEAAAAELLDGLAGDELDRMTVAYETNARMAPLTPDHHFYIDQGTNARIRLVLVCIGRHLANLGAVGDAEDVMFLKYDELRYLMADPEGVDVRDLISDRRDEREDAYEIRPRDWVGTATEEALAFPYLPLWGFPERLYRDHTASDRVEGLGASAGVIEGVARVVMSPEAFDQVESGEILVCQMTNPAWVTLFTKISGLVADAGGAASHPAVLAREFGIPAVIGTSVATQKIKTGDRLRVNGATGIVDILPAGYEIRETPPSDLLTT